MKIPFACPSCHATGSAEAAHAGKSVRCKHCGTRFAIPAPETREDEDIYSLEEPDESTARAPSSGLAQQSSFVRSRVDATAVEPGRKQRAGSGLTPTRPRRSAGSFAWQTWLIRGAAALVALLLAIGLLAPQGILIAGCILI